GVAYHARPAARGVAAPSHVAVAAPAQLAPALHRTRQPYAFDHLHRAVEGHPRHHFGIGEVARRSPHLPDARVRLHPRLFQVLEQRLLKTPGHVVAREARLARLVERIDDLAVDVELKL